VGDLERDGGPTRTLSDVKALGSLVEKVFAEIEATTVSIAGSSRRD